MSKDNKLEVRPKKYFSKYKKPLVPFPNLIEAQLKSFQWMIEKGIGEVFKEFSPISDYSGKKFLLWVPASCQRHRTTRARACIYKDRGHTKQAFTKSLRTA